MKKVYAEKNSLYFGKWNFLARKLKNFLYFFISFQERKTPKKIRYILGMECCSSHIKDLLYFLIFWEMKPFNPSSKNKNLPRENLLYFTKRKPRKYLLYFPKRKLFFFLGNGNPEKIIHTQKEFSYISGNRNCKKSLIF